MTKKDDVTQKSPEVEKALIKEAKNGDPKAFETLLISYKNYVGYIVDTCCWTCSEYREDFMQEGFLGLFRAVRTYDTKSSSFSTYAFQCIKNAVITAKRKYEREQPMATFEDTGEPSAEEIVIDRESTDLLFERMTDRLSKFERKVVELYIDGLRTSDIADALGATRKSVDNALSRAKRKLGCD